MGWLSVLQHHNAACAPEALFLIRVERPVIPKICFHLTIVLLLRGVYLQADDSLPFKSLVERVAENEKRNRLLEMSYVYEVTRQKISLGKNSETLECQSPNRANVRHSLSLNQETDHDYIHQ